MPRNIFKRSRTSTDAGTSSSAPLNPKFKSIDHEDRFNELFSGRSVIKERGFRLSRGDSEQIFNYILAYGWGALCTASRTHYPALVREFYANAWEEESEGLPSFTSWVRDREISYGWTQIAEFYGLQYADTGSDYDVHMLQRNDSDFLTSVAQVICREGAEWENDRSGRPNKLKRVDLQPLARAWHAFIICTLLPTSNVSEVTIPRAILIYTIMTGGLVHIGTLIQDQIRRVSQENSMIGPLPYPSLITHLCMRAGIVVEDTDLLPPSRAIDSTYIERFQKEYNNVCKAAAEAIDQAGTSAPPPPPSEAEPSSSAVPPAGPSTSAPSAPGSFEHSSMEQLMRSLMHDMEERLDRRNAERLDQMEQRLNERIDRHFTHVSDASYAHYMATAGLFTASRRDPRDYVPRYPEPPPDLVPGFPPDMSWYRDFGRHPLQSPPPDPPEDDVPSDDDGDDGASS